MACSRSGSSQVAKPLDSAVKAMPALVARVPAGRVPPPGPGRRRWHPHPVRRPLHARVRHPQDRRAHHHRPHHQPARPSRHHPRRGRRHRAHRRDPGPRPRLRLRKLPLHRLPRATRARGAGPPAPRHRCRHHRHGRTRTSSVLACWPRTALSAKTLPTWCWWRCRLADGALRPSDRSTRLVRQRGRACPKMVLWW